jgi:transposase
MYHIYEKTTGLYVGTIQASADEIHAYEKDFRLVKEV